MNEAIVIGCIVAICRFLIEKWGIVDQVNKAIKPHSVCQWCFFTWWSCVVVLAIRLPYNTITDTLLMLPVAVVIATVGYVYLKSQP